MKRQKIKIDKYVLSHIIEKPKDEVKVDKKEVAKYKMVNHTIDSVDEEDGGADYTAIIKRLADSKFFKLEYQEWDIDWEKGDFSYFPEELEEVFPKEVKTIIYE